MRQKYIAVVAFGLILCIILFAPYFWRLSIGNTENPGSQYYLMKQLGERYKEEGPVIFTEHPFSAYIFLLMNLDGGAARVLFLSLGALFCILLFLVMRRHRIRDDSRIFIITIWAASAAFITLVHMDGLTLLVMCLLAIAALYPDNLLLVAALMIASALVSPILLAGAFLLFLVYISYLQLSIRRSFIMALPGLFVGLVNWYVGGQFANTAALVSNESSFLLEFGAVGGIPIILFCLGAGGAILFWSRRFRDPYVIAGVLCIGTFFIPAWLPFLSLLLSIVAGMAFLHLANKVWKSSAAYRVFCLSVMAGLALSSVLGMHLVADMPPGQDLVRGLHVLSGFSPGITLSHPSYGSEIVVIGGQEVFVDELDGPIVQEMAEKIFQSYRLMNATTLLAEEEIDYIFITRDMREGLVWNRTGQGLLLLLQNERYFSSLYADDQLEIFEFSGAIVEQ